MNPKDKSDSVCIETDTSGTGLIILWECMGEIFVAPLKINFDGLRGQFERATVFISGKIVWKRQALRQGLQRASSVVLIFHWLKAVKTSIIESIFELFI